MKQKTKKILSYVYLVLSLLIMLSLLFSTIYLYKQVEQSKIKYKEYLSHYSNLNKNYEDCLSNNICACVCPKPNFDELCTGPITWCGPDKVGEWQIINGKCQWVCKKIIGGCGVVPPKDRQQCCDRWARENNIIIPMCVGQWEIINGRCSWNCRLGIAKIK